MTALALSFPALREATGIEPFDGGKLDAWAVGYANSGGRHAAQFVLALWDQSRDWRAGKFSVIEAFQVWDDDHRESFIRWAREPFWL